MAKSWERLLTLILKGPGYGPRASRLSRGGFIMILTLVAVATAGLVMVSTAPDLSAYGITVRSREMWWNLGSLRRAIRSRPLALLSVATAAPYGTPPSAPLTLQTTPPGLLDSPHLYDVLKALTVTEQMNRRKAEGGLASLGALSSLLTTVPVDPNVQGLEWFRPAYDPSPNIGGAFWQVSYNIVRDSTFLPPTALETYVPESLDYYYQLPNADNTRDIWRSDRFGVNVTRVTSYKGASNFSGALSPDGSRVAFVSNRLGIRQIYIVDTDGTGENPLSTLTSPTTTQDDPIWSPRGDKILYVQRGSGVGNDALMYCASGGGASTQITTGVVLVDKTLLPTALMDWSSDAQNRFVAYVYRKDAVTGPALAIYDMVAKTHILKPDGNQTYASDYLFNPRFAPGSTDLLFGTPGNGSGASELHVLTNIVGFPGLSQTLVVGAGGGDAYQAAYWYPDTVRAAANVSRRWIVYTRGSAPNDAYVYKKVAEAGATDVFRIDKTGPVAGFSLALSPGGNKITYRDKGGIAYATTSDGALEGPLGIPADPQGLSQVLIGPPRQFWSLAPASVQLLTPDQHGLFDPTAWSALLASTSDFEGDNKMGTAYLRVSPTNRQHHMLMDNGQNVYLIDDDPTVRGQPRTSVKSFLGLVAPTWSPRGLNFVGRKAQSQAGELPLECFKQIVDGSATTVLITTGIEPAFSPDDRWVAASRSSVALTTFPPNSTNFPMQDMDLWIVNSVGAPEPPPLDLTPGTPDSQERRPCWSPDGQYLYYQREVQQQNSFLGNHNSTIWRVTINGGVASEIVGNSACPAFWEGSSGVRSRVELYDPVISPDGTHLAFIGKERLLDPMYGMASGDIISEVVYVKDLFMNSEPVPLLRAARPGLPPDAMPPNNSKCSFDSLSWGPTGEELFVVRMIPMNPGYPRFSYDTHLNGPAPDYVPTYTDVVRILPVEPPVPPGRQVGTYVDPSGDNFHIVFRNGDLTDLPATNNQILSCKAVPGAAAFQRIAADLPVLRTSGVSTGLWYVLSGWVRTSSSDSDFHRGQLMVQWMGARGLLVPLPDNNGVLVRPSAPNVPDLQLEDGLVDLAGPHWQRFSAGLTLDPSVPGPRDTPPFTMNLVLYSTGLPGSYVEFAGLKLERAFDTTLLYPTAFSPDFTLFSPVKEPDPADPDTYLFER